MKQNAERLKKALGESHQLADGLDEPDFPLTELEVLQTWQRQRLAGSYQDLISQPRYAAAGNFFLDELYGGLNFRERDQEMERVLPVMVRMLPDDVLKVVAEAFELQSLSLEFDMTMTSALAQSGWSSINIERYGIIYRITDGESQRQYQIELIRRLGLALNELVRHKLMLFLVRTVKGPARAAGFGLLQSFLERGLLAFREMGDGSDFVETIWRRELEFSRRLFSGDSDPLENLD